MKAYAWLFSLLMFFSTSALADSFEIIRDGKTYVCELTEGGGSSCWAKCPWGFSSCVESCGGGTECWDRCPWGFSSCVESCGGGTECWDRCPWGFSTCAEECGSDGPKGATALSFIFNKVERMENERELLGK